MADEQKTIELQRMTDDELRAFIIDVVDHKIFTAHNLRPSDQQFIPMVFLPLAMGVLEASPPEFLKEIGTIYEYWDKAGPRSFNGYPIFTSCHLLWIEDWNRAYPKIMELINKREEERKELEI